MLQQLLSVWQPGGQFAASGSSAGEQSCIFRRIWAGIPEDLGKQSERSDGFILGRSVATGGGWVGVREML
jgi:hypothetical protein